MTGILPDRSNTFQRQVSGELIGYDCNFKACQGCPVKDKCTKSKKGRSIFRSLAQDFLDTIELKSKEDYAKYKKRQMIVEQSNGAGMPAII
jgi:hypothetical protein